MKIKDILLIIGGTLTPSIIASILMYMTGTVVKNEILIFGAITFVSFLVLILLFFRINSNTTDSDHSDL